MNKRDMQEILQAMDRHTKALTAHLERVFEAKPPAPAPPPARELLPIPLEQLHDADVQRMLNEYKAAVEWADKVLQDYRREVAGVQEQLKQLITRISWLEKKAGKTPSEPKKAVLEPEVRQSLKRVRK